MLLIPLLVQMAVSPVVAVPSPVAGAGTVTVVKQVQPPGTVAGSTAGGVPTGGWAFDASTSPSSVTISPSSGQTASGTGALTFDLNYPVGTTTTAMTVAETQQSGYTLNQIGGQNAVCTRVDTGADLPVANAPAGTGFTVTASSEYPISCTVYNIAPQQPAQVVVDKVWNVNGTSYADGAQPPALGAQLTLSGTNQDWGAPRTGLAAGATVPISETSSVASSSLCTLISQRLTNIDGTTVDLALPYSATLAAGANSYQITNTATCPARLTLLKSVLNGPASATAWTLTATAPAGALEGPSGITGVTAPVTPLVTYPMAESDADPRYVQLAGPGAVAIAGSTTSWTCSQVNPTTGAVVPGFADGLNGGVTVPLGFAVQCQARNQTAELKLVKQVVNDDSGTKLPSDWTLTATPTAPPTVPSGLVAQSVTGSTAGQVIAIRPGQPYTLTESTVPGYTMTSLTCATDTDPTPRPATSITLGPGASGTCTFVNDDDDRSARLTLVKTVTNDNGGTASPTEWTLAAAGPSPISGVTGSSAVKSAPVNAGTYTLSESGGPAGYVAGAWSCTGATASGNKVTIPSNGDVVCTINNNDRRGTFSVCKSSDPISGSTVRPGAVVTYTVTARKTGGVNPVDVAVVDDLSDVLNHATLLSASVTPSVGSAKITGTKLTWTIPSLSGVQTVTYQVKINADAYGVRLRNVITAKGSQTCAPGGPAGGCSTTHVTPKWTLTKSSDPASGSTVAAGSTITYQLQAKNRSKAVVDHVTVTDDLSAVLSHARLLAVPNGAELRGTKLIWRLPTLQPGKDAKLRYQVKLRSDAFGVWIRNVATPGVGGACLSSCTTQHKTRSSS